MIYSHIFNISSKVLSDPQPQIVVELLDKMHRCVIVKTFLNYNFFSALDMVFEL